MKKFVLFGISKEYGSVSTKGYLVVPEDFEPKHLQEYQGKDGEELFVKEYKLAQEQKEV